jgi:hypothetical protein
MGLLSFLAAEVAKPSKTPFFIAGGALAAWAVIVSALGLSRPAFPGGQGAARAVSAISAVLVVAAMATAIITA